MQLLVLPLLPVPVHVPAQRLRLGELHLTKPALVGGFRRVAFLVR